MVASDEKEAVRYRYRDTRDGIEANEKASSVFILELQFINSRFMAFTTRFYNILTGLNGKGH